MNGIHPLVTVDQFLQEGIQSIMSANPKPNNVLFLTYRQVGGVDRGTHCPRQGLTMHVQSGTFTGPSIQDALKIFLDPTGILRSVREQQATESFMNASQPIPSIGLAFVYVGVHSFQEPLQHAMRLGETTSTYIVSCDCNLGQPERSTLTRMVGTDVKGVIITEHCGGASAMGDIYKKIVELY